MLITLLSTAAAADLCLLFLKVGVHADFNYIIPGFNGCCDCTIMIISKYIYDNLMICKLFVQNYLRKYYQIHHEDVVESGKYFDHDCWKIG